MDNNKVTLPRDVAEAIVSARELFTDGEIVSAAVGWSDFGEKSLKTIHGWTKEDSHDTRQNLLMSALVNGYTVEQTPEEKVREYYVNLRNLSQDAGPLSYESDCKMNAIVKTLNLLGIKIEGVNA